MTSTLDKKMGALYVDDVFELFGWYGYVQLFVFFQTSFVCFIDSWNVMGYTFLGITPDHHCKVPLGADPDQVIPFKYDETTGEKIIDRCHLINITSGELLSCPDGWWYGHEYESTIVAEWDLVCDKAVFVQTSQSIYFLAKMAGCLLAPAAADYLGRKYVVIFCAVVWACLGICTAFVNNFYLFTAIRAVFSALEMGSYLVSYCLLSEFYPTKYRTLALNGFYLAWALGLMSFAGIGYAVRDWRHLQLIIAVPLLVYLVGYWTLPESVHYLITHGRSKQGEDLVKRMAAFSKVSLPGDFKLKVDENENNRKEAKRNIFLGIATTPYLRLYALLLIFVWFVDCLVYYGLSLATNSLAGDPYLNFFLFGAVEIPAYLSCLFLLKACGRRKPTLFFHLLTGLPLLITYFIPENAGTTNLSTLITTLNLVGKYGVTASFSAIYQITTEVYPTIVRNTGLGISSFSARIAAAIAPFTVYFQQKAPAVQPILFGTLALVAGAMIMLVPETRCRTLPETLDEYHGWVKNVERKDTEEVSTQLNNDDNVKESMTKTGQSFVKHETSV